MAITLPLQTVPIIDPVFGSVDREFMLLNPFGHENLLITLHGGGGAIAIWMVQTGLLDLLYNNEIPFGLLALQGIQYNPTATPGSGPSMILTEAQRLSSQKVNGHLWADGRIVTFSNSNGYVAFNDSFFIEEMILLLTGRIGTLPNTFDPQRVFIMGGSNGGGMAQKFAAEHPTRIAGVGAIAMTLGTAYHGLEEPGILPIWYEHGTRDPLNGYNGATRSGESTMPSTQRVAFWLRNNEYPIGSLPDLVTTLPNTDPHDGCMAVRNDYTSVNPMVVVEVQNGGHTVRGPQTVPDPILDDDRPGYQCKDGNAITEMCDWFNDVIVGQLPRSWVLSGPQLPLFGALRFNSLTGTDVTGTDRDYAASEIQTLAERLQGSWGGRAETISPAPTADTLDAIRELNPNHKSLGYINSSYSQANIADCNEVEADRFTNIMWHLEGTLQTALPDGVGTTVIVTRSVAGASGKHIAASTIPGTLSTGLDNFVSCIRIGNELMRTETVSDADAALTTAGVTRGFQGSTAIAHLAGVNVYSPIHIRGSQPGDTPVSGQGPRYALNAWEDATMNLSLMRTDAAHYINVDKRDGLFLDILSAQFYNMLGAKTGNTSLVTPWNFDAGHVMTEAEHVDLHDLQMKKLQDTLLADTGAYPVLAGNNMNADYGPDGGLEKLLTVTATKPRPVDFFFFEGFGAKPSATPPEYHPLATWQQNVAALCDGWQLGLGLIPHSKPTDDFSMVPSADTNYNTAEFYDYCSVLLAWEPENTLARVGLAVNVDPDGGAAGPGDWVFHFEDYWNYDIGDPVEDDNSDGLDLTPLQVGTHSYDREYTRAYVIVNPSTSAEGAPINLPASRLWKNITTWANATTVTPGANTASVWAAYDYEVDDDSAIATVIDTLTPSFGTGPYTYEILGTITPFGVEANGDIVIQDAFVHTTFARWIMTLRITDSLDVSEEIELIFVSKA